MTSIGFRSASGSLVVSGAGSTHPGRVRAVNEDALLTDPTGELWAVADGVGGHGHGDLAADMVIDALAGIPHGRASADLLRHALETAHARIRAEARARGLGAIGSTVVVALIEGTTATIVWAGDSRCYLRRGETLTRLTRDHSVVQDLLDRGQILASEAEGHGEAHVITRAVGATEVLEPESRAITLAHLDRLLLCSDGLTRCLSDPEINAILDPPSAPGDVCQALVDATLARGAPDNVSVVVVDLVAPAPTPRDG